MFNLNSLKFYDEPFPHIIVDNFIDDEEMVSFLCDNEELPNWFKDREIGPLGRMSIRSNNEKHDEKTAVDLKRSTYFSDDFKTKISSVLDAYAEDENVHEMIKHYFEPIFKNTYRKFREKFKEIDVSYGAYNKTAHPLNTIGWHLDQGTKLMSGFVYLREATDIADDGALYLSSGQNQGIKKIDYGRNVFVIWPNLITAWHKAGVRAPTENLRRLINVVYSSSPKRKYHDYRTPRTEFPYDSSELYSNKIFGFKKVNII